MIKEKIPLPSLLNIFEWLLLTVGLAALLTIAAQSANPGGMILILLLYLITRNFSLPLQEGAAGLVGITAISSILILGFIPAVQTALLGLLLAETARPIWEPLWIDIAIPRATLKQRLAISASHLAALSGAGFIYQQSGGFAPLTVARIEFLTNQTQLIQFSTLSIVYILIYMVFNGSLWPFFGWDLRRYITDIALLPFITTFFGAPFAILGGISFAYAGLLGFTIFGLGIAAFSLIIWISWERQYTMEKQLNQLSRLNLAGNTIRETLDLKDVLQQTYNQINQFLTVDHFAIFLKQNDHWYQALQVSYDPNMAPPPIYEPDDLTQWVINQEKVLDLTYHNHHFAKEYYMQLPEPLPAAWLGIPLNVSDELIGVLVLQQMNKDKLFSQWSKEILFSIAGQASSAIQNASLYAEIVRLYNLSDEALALRVKQLQALLNAIQEGVLMMDTAGRIVLINKTAAHLLNQPSDALREHIVQPEAIAPYLGFATIKQFSQLLTEIQNGAIPEAATSTFTTNFPLAGEPIRRRFIERSELPVQGDNDELIGWLIILRDITEAEELAERKADVTRMIIHDLRNPVTTLLSTLNLIDQKQPLQNRDITSELVSTARLGCDSMLDMIDSLLDVNRMESGELIVDVDAMYFSPLAQKVIARLSPLAEQRQVTLIYQPEDPLPAIWGDAELLRRVLVNLLDNALKFTPSGGTIQLQIKIEPSTTPQAEDGIRVIVRDNGPGIPEAYLDRVFDRFMTINQGGAQVRGTGLGLTFCKLAIEAQNGRIWIEQQPNQGGCFIFTIPGPPLLE